MIFCKAIEKYLLNQFIFDVMQLIVIPFECQAQHVD